MKIAVVAMVAIAGSASADFTSIDRSDYTIYTDVTATPIGVDSAQRGVGATVYSNMTNAAEGFFSLGSGPADGDGVPQAINFDDYQSIAPGGGLMAEFQFVGGVTVAGGAMPALVDRMA